MEFELKMYITKNFIIYYLALFCLFFEAPNLKATELSPLPIKLSLKQAIEETLNNNTSIAVQKFNSKINEQAILEKKADFDTTLNVEFSAGEETRQAAGAFANPVKSSTSKPLSNNPLFMTSKLEGRQEQSTCPSPYLMSLDILKLELNLQRHLLLLEPSSSNHPQDEE